MVPLNYLCSDQLKPHWALLSAQLCFSGWQVLGSIALRGGADPFVFVLYRCLLSVLIMFAYVKLMNMNITIMREDYPRFAALGFILFVNVISIMLALTYLSAARFSLFQPGVPCVATAISTILGYDQLSMLRVAGIAVAITGALLIELLGQSNNGNGTNNNGGSDSSEGSDSVLGIIMVVLQVLSLAGLQVFQKPLLARYEPAVVTLVFYSLGSVGTLVLVASLACAGFFTASDFTFQYKYLPFLAVLYTVIFTTVYAFIATSWALKRLTPSVTSIYVVFQPLGTVLLSFIFLRVTITYMELVGGVVVVVGLLMTVMGSSRVPENDKSEPTTVIDCDCGDSIDGITSGESSNIYCEQVDQRTIDSTAGTIEGP